MPPRALADGDGDPFLGMVVGGRFAVLERLGAGSMGTVYRARQEAMGRDVALKIVRSERLLDAQSRARFQQEARATSLLTSPYTVRVIDFGEIAVSGLDPHFLGGSQYLAMELLVGESLGERLKHGGRIQPEAAIRICRQVLSSLAEAHSHGVIHRDLKPDNIYLVRDPVGGGEMCRVLDFGIAKVLGSERESDALATQQGTVFGTPRYMSPEQAQGKALDARSDLYALGVILYHMLLGRPPYTDADAVVVMAHHIKTRPPSVREAAPDLVLARDLEALLLRALEKSPLGRPQSATEFIAALDALGDGSGPVAARPNDVASGELAAVVGSEREARRGRRTAVLAAFAAAGPEP
ncbi:MAG: serine/threonine protein kinase, partial [Myxococcales bacterium]|nr:serine/threonine protein kinase [Myxococcales bacterium]